MWGLEFGNKGDEFQKYLAGFGDWWNVTCEGETHRFLTGASKWLYCLQRSYRMKKREKIWERDKNVNIHGKFEVMLGRLIRTVYQTVRYVSIPPWCFGTWSYESRIERWTEKVLRGIVSWKITREEFEGGTYEYVKHKEAQIDRNWKCPVIFDN